jgi:hypothetical protein
MFFCSRMAGVLSGGSSMVLLGKSFQTDVNQSDRVAEDRTGQSLRIVMVQTTLS